MRCVGLSKAQATVNNIVRTTVGTWLSSEVSDCWCLDHFFPFGSVVFLLIFLKENDENVIEKDEKRKVGKSEVALAFFEPRAHARSDAGGVMPRPLL